MVRHRFSKLVFATFVLAVGPWSAGQALDLKKLLEGVTSSSVGSSAASALTDGEIGQGLKEALAQGVERAINTLGRPNGYLGNAQVKIPLPESLQTIESALRATGQSRYADQFVESMNRAAEEAVPEAATIFSNAIRKMTLADARKILNGPQDAATQYFKRVSTDHLVGRFRPIVERATNSVGVTSSYKDLVGKAGFVGSLLGKDTTDIDGYVTNKAVDGLFTVVAAEEKRIRTEPVARTTDLLKRVFSR